MPRAVLNLICTFFAFLFASTGSAYPPAPGFSIRGVEREGFGWAYQAADAASLKVKRGGVVIASTEIDGSSLQRGNFSLLVPLDTRLSDSYRPTAQLPDTLVTFEVEVGGSIFPIVGLSVAESRVGEAAGSVFLDLTTGVDSDGDGLPDEWEMWQLFESGLSYFDPGFSLDAFSAEGDFDNDGTSDYVEYLAGTYAFLNSEGLTLDIQEKASDGLVRLSALLVFGKIYRIEGSDDLQAWETMSVAMGERSSEGRTQFEVSDTRDFDLWVTSEANESFQYYRLILVQ